jgi:hypothetical protein
LSIILIQKGIFNNPESLIQMSLAVALNDSSIYYSQKPVFKSIKRIILNSLAIQDSTQSDDSCLFKLLADFFIKLNEFNGDFEQALIDSRNSNCYTELESLIDLISRHLYQLISKKTVWDGVLMNLNKFAEYGLKSLLEILKDKVDQKNITSATTSSTQIMHSSNLSDLIDLIK